MWQQVLVKYEDSNKNRKREEDEQAISTPGQFENPSHGTTRVDNKGVLRGASCATSVCLSALEKNPTEAAPVRELEEMSET